ncbi:hypothetical protein GCM10009799_40790 [Nocardiopsis rhodophaea]|uniref:Integral membrane protein n=2 Tax=Nocardiopsis rhodophaea TaxID=280238 RepID=A0ABN2TGP2_9ACTN
MSYPQGQYPPPHQQPYGPPGQPYQGHPQWGHPQPGYSPQPPGYPYGAPPPANMPGKLLGVRITMFILGGIGLLFSGVCALVLWAGSEAGGGQTDLLADFPPEVFLVILLITGVYGVLSVGLAALMGKRSQAVWWLVVIFQGCAAVWCLWGVLAGNGGSSVPLIFAVALFGSLLPRSCREYYRGYA